MHDHILASDQPKGFIACGMYAFTDELQAAWQELFSIFIDQIDFGKVSRKLSFETSETILRNPDLLIGHTCGYPLMTKLIDDLVPICVPRFDIPGCDDRFYSSHFIVNQKSHINSLADCYQARVAINNFDSNSGMNVLRQAIAKLDPGKPFFSEVRETGSHITSFMEVADGLADMAAIDCVSYQLISDNWPGASERVRSIGFSEKTSGLPFVISKAISNTVDPQILIDALNQALNKISTRHKKSLHLVGFEPVSIDDYQGILDIEDYAISSGYPDLC